MFIGQCNKPATATGSDSKVVKKNIQTSRLLLWNDRLLLLGLMIKHFTWISLKRTVLNRNKTFLLTAWISKKKKKFSLTLQLLHIPQLNTKRAND